MGGDLITAEDEHIPQRYPGGNAPILPTETRYATATVTQANIDDYTVDIELNVKPTTTQVQKAGPSFRRCQVLCDGGQTETGTAWAKLRLPLKNSIVSVLFVPGQLDPIVFNCLLFPEAETLHGNVKAMIDKLNDPEDWVDVHSSGVEIIVRKDKTIKIAQPSGVTVEIKPDQTIELKQDSGAEVVISTAGEIHLKQAAGQKVKVGTTIPVNHGVVLEALLTAAWGAAWTAFLTTPLSGHNFHFHSTPVGPSGPPVTPATTPTLSGHASSVVEGQPS